MWLKCSLCSKNCFLPYSRLFSSTLNFFEFPWRFELSVVDCIYSHNLSKVLLYLHGVCSCFLCGIFLIRSGLGISSTPKLKFKVSKVKYGQKPQGSWRIIFFFHIMTGTRLVLACENIRFSWLFAAGDGSRETFQAAKSEEKRMFSHARLVSSIGWCLRWAQNLFVSYLKSARGYSRKIFSQIRRN